jgi:hypothetical protein
MADVGKLHGGVLAGAVGVCLGVMLVDAEKEAGQSCWLMQRKR